MTMVDPIDAAAVALANAIRDGVGLPPLYFPSAESRDRWVAAARSVIDDPPEGMTISWDPPPDPVEQFADGLLARFVGASLPVRNVIRTMAAEGWAFTPPGGGGS